MAKVRELRPGHQEVAMHKTEVTCFHQVVAGPDGSRYLHLSTFGSVERASQPKSSQSLQLDRVAASALVAVLEATFPGLLEEQSSIS